MLIPLDDRETHSRCFTLLIALKWLRAVEHVSRLMSRCSSSCCAGDYPDPQSLNPSRWSPGLSGPMRLDKFALLCWQISPWLEHTRWLAAPVSMLNITPLKCHFLILMAEMRLSALLIASPWVLSVKRSAYSCPLWQEICPFFFVLFQIGLSCWWTL